MGTPSGNAMLRTTTAVTVISGGNKENVLPESAEALVNFRLLPGDTVGDIETLDGKRLSGIVIFESAEGIIVQTGASATVPMIPPIIMIIAGSI